MKLRYACILWTTAAGPWVSLVHAWTTPATTTTSTTTPASNKRKKKSEVNVNLAVATPTTSFSPTLTSSSTSFEHIHVSQQHQARKTPFIMVSSSPSSSLAEAARRHRTWTPKLEEDDEEEDEEDDDEEEEETLTTASASYLPTSSRSNNKGLSRAQEIEMSFHIHRYRAVVRMRDQLRLEKQQKQQQEVEQVVEGSTTTIRNKDITEREWARACGMTVQELRKVMQQAATARELMVAANVGLVTSIAKTHHQAKFGGGGGGAQSRTLQDMIQEGNIGLLKAAELFQPEKGFRFSTYATFWIRQRIRRSISDSSRLIRLPAHVQSTLHRIHKVRKEMAARIGREPSVPELAHELEMTVEKLQKYTDSSKHVLSLEDPLRSSASSSTTIDRRTLGDVLASDAPTPEEDAQANYLKRDIQTVMETELALRERLVISLRFGFIQDGKPRNVEETAKLLGISRDRVRLVEARALNKLRSPQRNYRLKEYVISSSPSSSTSYAADHAASSSSSSSSAVYPHSTLTTSRTTAGDTSSRRGSDRIWFF